MQVRANTTKKMATIKFNLINPDQYQHNDLSVSKQIEMLSPALADNLCVFLGVEATQVSAQLMRNKSRAVFGCKMELTVLLDEAKQKLNAAALQAELICALPQSVSCLDPDLRTLKFAPINSEEFSVTYSDEPTDKMSFKGRVSKRAFTYTSLDETDSISVHFINESEQASFNHVTQNDFAYDRWRNLTAINYTYTPYQPNAESLQRLEDEAESLLKSTFAGKYKPFLQSIKERNFGQALRRACADGLVELFLLLARFANERVIVLDLNEFTLTSKKTPLDYALESKNEVLIKLLKDNKAKTFKECARRMVNSDREEIYKQNPPREQNPFTQSSIFSNHFQQTRQKPEQPPRRPQDLISEVFVEQCLRTNQSFAHYVHGQMTKEERRNLEQYERQRREEYRQQQARRAKDTFDMHHAHHGRDPFGEAGNDKQDPFDAFSFSSRWH